MNSQKYLKEIIKDPKIIEEYKSLKDTESLIKALLIKSMEDEKTMLNLFSCISCIAIALADANNADINEVLDDMNHDFKERIKYFQKEIKKLELH